MENSQNAYRRLLRFLLLSFIFPTRGANINTTFLFLIKIVNFICRAKPAAATSQPEGLFSLNPIGIWINLSERIAIFRQPTPR